MSIRERDAADWGPLHEVVTGYREACQDRRILLAALDALVEAAEEFVNNGGCRLNLDGFTCDTHYSEMKGGECFFVGWFRAAIEAAKGASDE